MEAIIFDMDGVITETAELHYIAWKNELKKYCIDFEWDLNNRIRGLNRRDTLNAILKYYKRSSISEEQKDKILFNKNRAYINLLETDLTRDNILPGIINLLNDAKKKDIKMAVASSSKNASFILLKLELLHYFEFIVNPSKVSEGKPNPEIYIKACEGLRVHPENCVGIEDALSGIEGLNKANIFSIGIKYNQKGNWSNSKLLLKSTNNLCLKKIIKRFEKIKKAI